MMNSTRFRLIGSFLSVCILVGGLSLLIGVRLLNRSVVNEAANRVRLDLNAARGIYGNVESSIRLALEIAVKVQAPGGSFTDGGTESILARLERLAAEVLLDFAGFVTADGITIARLNGPPDTERLRLNPAAQLCLERRETVSGTVVLDSAILTAEGPELARKAAIELLPTPRAADRMEPAETSGMAIAAAVPVIVEGSLIGVLYGGTLLNRSTDIVDTVRDTVFLAETYGGRSIGTATIFLGDTRISTNVLTSDGERAVGTRVSLEVRDKVLLGGGKWTDRAFVVNDWYITAYEPIVDISGDLVGILYVGVLEEKYVQLRRRTVLVFVLITGTGMVTAVLLGFALGQRILGPVQRLIDASRRVSAGDLDPDIGPMSHGEMGLLQRTFTEMISSLKERDRHQKAESDLRLLQSEKQASVGRLAAGVAHEINNPLTGVVTFTHLLLRRSDLGDDVRRDLEMVAESTDRVRKIVKGLLDFSRQTKIDPEPTDINDLIENTIPLVANQALVKGVIFCFDPCPELPLRTLDRSQFQSVLLNIIINAVDATERRGHITISTCIAVSAGAERSKGVEIRISDTGCGIDPEHLDKLFDPFFTTKEVGKGTGLGLSVSQGIVERHGGSIRVESMKGEGSTFTIWLPLEPEGEL